MTDEIKVPIVDKQQIKLPHINDGSEEIVKNQERRDKINKHWQDLKGALGNATSELEEIGNGYRIRYEHGTIYLRNNIPVGVYGAIAEKYDALGGALGRLGFPITDETTFGSPPEEGRVSTFEHGSIYWWSDVGAIELNDVVVRYTGLICFGETDWTLNEGNSDEPYVILGVISPTGQLSTRSKIYGDEDGTDGVDDGESRPDLMELYRGKPYGITLNGVLMERDFGDPDKYKSEVTSVVAAASQGISLAIAAIPGGGTAIAAIVAPLLAAAVPKITDAVNTLLGTADDLVSQFAATLTAKQMVVLAARTQNSVEKGVSYKWQSPLLAGDGASYKVYFGIDPA
jgi:hypothetical protein